MKAKPTYTFDANASYLITGAFGGIGRSIASWLARRGARNLILLSRSGPSSAAASSLLLELRSSGIRVEAPVCDITKYDVLARTIS